MTTSLLGATQAGSSGQRVVSLPGTGPGGRPAEIEFRDLRYFAVVAEVLLVHTCWYDHQHTAPSRGAHPHRSRP
jgi:hypothetical protein